MNLAELIELSNNAGVEVFSEDNANVFLVKSFVFGTSPYTYKAGIQSYSSKDQFPDDLIEAIEGKSRHICPFDPDAQARLCGDLQMTGTLSEVRDYLRIHQRPMNRLWVEHLGITARFDAFMYSGWYIPLQRDANLGLISYLRGDSPDTAATTSSTAAYALTKPKLTH